jgi:meso-butanediol dehydrogenase/(S,S)-butanediol dehydrogenase/diacetyl reductase
MRTNSAMTKDMQANPELLAKFNERMPLGDARYVTGVNLPVDAGLTASNGQPTG